MSRTAALAYIGHAQNAKFDSAEQAACEKAVLDGKKK
jgi:hypothetical protein